MLDTETVLAIALGVLVMALTALGSIITANRAWQRWAFAVGGVIGVILLVVQGMRTNNLQRENQIRQQKLLQGQQDNEKAQREILRLQQDNKRVQEELLRRTTEISAKIISPVLDGAQLVPGLYYPHEWDRYKGVTRQDAVVVIDPDDPPRRKYSERIPIYITSVNLNMGIPLEEGTINLYFNEDGLKIEPGKGWGTGEPNKAYHRRFPNAITNTVVGTLEDPLFVRFPRPGKYHVLVTLGGKWVKNPPHNKLVTFELYD